MDTFEKGVLLGFLLGIASKKYKQKVEKSKFLKNKLKGGQK